MTTLIACTFDDPTVADANARLREGGAGSGNYGHAGRPGEVGGSSAGGVHQGEDFTPDPRLTKVLATSDELQATAKKTLHLCGVEEVTFTGQLWHGVRTNEGNAAVVAGAAFKNSDVGYYGPGLYFATEPQGGARYGAGGLFSVEVEGAKFLKMDDATYQEVYRQLSIVAGRTPATVLAGGNIVAGTLQNMGYDGIWITDPRPAYPSVDGGYGAEGDYVVDYRAGRTVGRAHSVNPNDVLRRPHLVEAARPGLAVLFNKSKITTKLHEGGAGSGNHGHAGRPGVVGGSAPTAGDYLHKISVIHDHAKHNPTNPDVAKAYDAFKTQVLQQYHTLKDNGVKFEFTDKDPYATSKEMRADALGNKHLAVYNKADDLQADHPLNAPAEDGQTYNTIFRGVHDYLGHAMPGNQFGPKGELAAYQAHAKWFTEDALPALAAETLAQNAWVNYADGHQDLAPKDRPFAQQKAYAFPKDLAQHVARGRFPQWLLTMRESDRKPGTLPVTVPINMDELEEADYRRPRDEAQLREAYNPDQPRDAHGRWAGDGTSAIAGEAVRITARAGGVTMDTKTGAAIHEGFAVGGANDAPESHLPYSALTKSTVLDYMKQDAVRSALNRPNRYLGIWWNKEDGQAYLDVSEVPPRPHACS